MIFLAIFVTFLNHSSAPILLPLIISAALRGAGRNGYCANLLQYPPDPGSLYQVIGVAHHSETLEELVVYKALYDSEEFGPNSLWVRPKKMFTENVVVDGKETPRFRYVG